MIVLVSGTERGIFLTSILRSCRPPKQLYYILIIHGEIVNFK